MTALEWDRSGERYFQTGVDRGVLYTVEGEAVPWNGLTQIAENTTAEVKSFYMDGVKYLDHFTPGAYSAKLEAFTYPDLLDGLTGIAQYAPGVFLHDQNAKVFHLSYRTKVGNDLDQDFGYKIHIIYNVLAVASSSGFSTIGGNVEPTKFSWDLSGTPPSMFGARPTAHISLNSLGIDSDLLETLEAMLYGDEAASPILPSMIDLLTMIEGT